MGKLVIQNGTVVFPSQEEVKETTLVINDGKITEIGPRVAEGKHRKLLTKSW